MSNKTISQGFAARLTQALIQAGLTSSRSKSGVSMVELTKISGNSRQICRKYLLGEVLPEPYVIANLARYLSVSPGWLLFGELEELKQNNSCIHISKNVLDYILKHPMLYRIDAGYLLHMLEKISSLNFNDDQMKKVIDLSFAGFRREKASASEINRT